MEITGKFKSAISLFQQGDAKASLEVCREIIESQPDDIKISLLFFYNRTGFHSPGPWPAEGSEWNRQGENIIGKRRSDRQTLDKKHEY